MRPAFPGLCSWCRVDGFRVQGHLFLCKKHYRFQQMRSKAKQVGKKVPSYDELEKLLNELSDFKCPKCNRGMNWLSKEGTSSVLTLQHDHSGDVRFLCLSCNVRHGGKGTDEFYSWPNNHKKCPGCKLILPFDKFATDRSDRFENKYTYCRKCATLRHKVWVSNNREIFNMKRRAYYHARKESGKPLPR